MAGKSSSWTFLVLMVGLFATSWVSGQAWIEWNNVTATNIIADPSVGAGDVEEKDFIVGDFDLDGDPDLVVVRKLPFTTFGNRVNVLFMNTDGVLSDQTATLAPDLLIADNARDVMTGNFNGDAYPDLVIANAGNGSSNGQQPRILINLGDDGMGNWLGFQEQASRLPVMLSGSGSEPNACAVGVGDVTGNGVDDLYLVDYQNDLEDKLLINDGTGFFTEETNSRLPAGFETSAFATAGMIVDLNGDGALDIIKDSTPSITVAYNDGTGNFPTSEALNVTSAYHFTVGDLNNDSLNDLFIVQDPQDQFLMNTSPAGTIPVVWSNNPLTSSPLTSGFGGNVYIHDLDVDGDQDVVVTDVDTDVSGCARRLAFLQSDGATPTPNISDPYNSVYEAQHHLGTYDVAIADFNDDGYPDIWVGHCSGNDLYFQVPPMTSVSPIQGLTCSQVILDVQLSWTNPQGYDNVEVRRGGVPIATLGGSAVSYTDVNPGDGDYAYSIVGSVASTSSTPVACVVSVSTVNQPTNAACFQIDEDVQLSWQNEGSIDGTPYSNVEIRRNGLLVQILPGTATQYLDLAPPIGNTLYSIVGVVGPSTSAQETCSINVAPTNATDIVLDFAADDGGSTDSAAALVQALQDNQRVVNHLILTNVTDLPSLNIDLNDFERCWVELGGFPNSKTLTAAEGQILADFVSDGVGGGDLYLSGADTFFLGPMTAVHSLLGLTATSDGSGSVANVAGLAGATCDLSSFTQVSFSGEDDFVDRLSATSGENILQANLGGNTFTAAVFTSISPQASIIAQSVEFGGIGEAHDKSDLMELYLHCFPSGFPPPVAGFTASPVSGVVPLTVSFSSDNSGGIVESHSWDFGDGNMSSGEDPVHTFTTTGTFTVSYTVSGPGGSDTETQVGLVTVFPDAPPYLRGDANNDSVVNLADGIEILGWVFGTVATQACEAAFDANSDGGIDISDAVRVLGHLFNGEPSLDAPFPSCGFDPQPPTLSCIGSVCP